MLNKILIPIDFSAASDNAIKYGLEWAKQTGDEIMLFHANQVPDSDPFTPAYAYHKTGDVEVKYQKVVAERMEEILGELKHSAKDVVSTAYGTAVGDPITEIRNVVKEENISLIIVGMSAEGKDQALYYKDQVLDLIEEAEIPVLVIPEMYVFEPIHKIVYGSNEDEEEENFKTLKSLSIIAERFDASITVLHISDKKDSEKHKEEFTGKVRSQVNYHKLDFVRMENDDVVEGLSAYFQGRRTDLLVMLTRKRNFIEILFDKSLTKKMAAKTKVPLLAYHQG